MMRWAYIAICLVAGTNSYGQELRMQFQGPSSILIGEQTRIKLVSRGVPDALQQWPALSGKMESGVEVLLKDSISDRTNDIYEQEMVITAFDSGFLTIDSVFMLVEGDTVFSNSLTLEVQLVEVDTTQDIRDIKDIAEVSGTPQEEETQEKSSNWFASNWYWLLGGALLIGLVLFFILRKKRQSTPAPPARSPAEEAFYRLSQLESQGMWQKGDIKGYYVELSDILRRYIERRYDFRAMEKTTGELMSGIRSRIADSALQHALKSVLELSDMAKFAKASHSEADHRASIESAKRFVQQTLDKVQEGMEKPPEKE